MTENIRNIVGPRAGALVQELTDVLYQVYVEISPETTNVQIRSPDVVGSTHLIKVFPSYFWTVFIMYYFVQKWCVC